MRQTQLLNSIFMIMLISFIAISLCHRFRKNDKRKKYTLPYTCTDSDRTAHCKKNCEDRLVCGDFELDIQCIKAPCGAATFTSVCEACLNESVITVYDGFCAGDENYEDDDYYFPEEIQETNYCTEEEKLQTICTYIYDPVCGFRQVTNELCLNDANCNQTYGNRCVACSQPGIIFVLDGTCDSL